jgi:hypothetical protein
MLLRRLPRANGFTPDGTKFVFERGTCSVRTPRHNYLLEGLECVLWAFFWIIAIPLWVLVLAVEFAVHRPSYRVS